MFSTSSPLSCFGGFPLNNASIPRHSSAWPSSLRPNHVAVTKEAWEVRAFVNYGCGSNSWTTKIRIQPIWIMQDLFKFVGFVGKLRWSPQISHMMNYLLSPHVWGLLVLCQSTFMKSLCEIRSDSIKSETTDISGHLLHGWFKSEHETIHVFPLATQGVLFGSIWELDTLRSLLSCSVCPNLQS